MRMIDLQINHGKYGWFVCLMDIITICKIGI